MSFTADAEDPLAGWIVQLQNLQHEPEALLPKLKRVCTMYQSEKRYRNDDRYVRLWIAFADSTGKPCKIFERMHSRSIGAKLALFWVAWSCAAHTAGDREEALRLLREGRDSGAQPLKMLQEMMQDLDLGQLSPAPRHQHSDTTAAGNKRPREAAARDVTAAAIAETDHTQAAAAAAAIVSESDGSVIAAAAVAQVTASTAVRKQPLAHRDHNQRAEQPAEKARKAVPPTTAAAPPQQQQQQPKRRKKPAAAAGGAALAPVRTAKRQPGAANDSPDCAETATATAAAAVAVAAVHPYREPHRTASTVQSPAYLAWEAQHRGVVLHDLSSSSSSSSRSSGQTLRKWPKKMATLRPYTSVQYTAAGTGVAGSGSSSSVEAKLGSRTVRVEGVLGEGAYAVVYRCKLRSGDEKHCAVKVRVCFISVALVCSCVAAA
jgi:Mad3/BUB1 homology region 1